MLELRRSAPNISEASKDEPVFTRAQAAGIHPTPTPAPIDDSSLFQSQSPGRRPTQSSLADIDASRLLLPCVHRLLGSLANPKDIVKIKGTCVRGMATRDDTLAFLGQAGGPLGTLGCQRGEAVHVARSVVVDIMPLA
ncbi:hypothetical protein FIBSPDRAFT_1036655 [Athelia psychrophila]|uniref:Uncharacterized protein n=1 Tax=Athelia psychrophila TaxID=1759441 RepID=A0A166V8L6_9AGAM|nr:hypothetical protein FIBSPDRAFT_1036655 [Fibularhizoctonia sp. CBS 109695]